MGFSKRLSYYFFGLLIGSVIVYFITSQKNTEFNYFPSDRVIGDIKKKEWVFDESFVDISKNDIINNFNINFSKSDIGIDSCNSYYLENKNFHFIAKNCTKKVYFLDFTPSK